MRQLAARRVASCLARGAKRMGLKQRWAKQTARRGASRRADAAPVNAIQLTLTHVVRLPGKGLSKTVQTGRGRRQGSPTAV